MPETALNGSRAALLFLHAQTALHPGSGTALGVVDLPVQRERHTQWPTIPGSSLKGVLRDACRRKVPGERSKADADPDLAAAFGPPTKEADKHAGALSVTDARILAFPVRSLKGVFAWVTCPAVLERLNRDLGLIGREGVAPVPAVKSEGAACADGPLVVAKDRLILEEFEFTRVGDAADVARWLGAAVDGETAKRLATHLVVLSDDDFTYFVRHATEVVARVGLDYERKTVRKGALFYQEFLPAETLFYALVIATASRSEKVTRDAAAMLGYWAERMRETPVLQIGGDETIGKGLCAARVSGAQEVRS